MHIYLPRHPFQSLSTKGNRSKTKGPSGKDRASWHPNRPGHHGQLKHAYILQRTAQIWGPRQQPPHLKGIVASDATKEEEW